MSFLNYWIKIISMIIIIIIIFPIFNIEIHGVENDRFIDVPENHWAEKEIYDLKALGIIKGTINSKNEVQFGLDNKITRIEFLAMLVRLLNLESTENVEVSFRDVKENEWYYEELKAGISKNIVIQSEDEYKGLLFQPNDYISRIEMAKMIVRSLGYDYLAKELKDINLEFKDVSDYKGYIEIAKSLGIINGKSTNDGVKIFAPDEDALKVEGVAMISRMYRIMNQDIDTLHGFYAISSFSQIDKITGFNSLGFGWSALKYDGENNKVILSTEKSQDNDYYIPKGYEEPYNIVVENNIRKYLMVYSNNSKITVNVDNQKVEVGLLENLLQNEENQNEVIKAIVNNVRSTGFNKKIEFDGVIIDFEGLKNRFDARERYNHFLSKIKNELNRYDKELIGCLQPIRNNRSYFDGYDYGEIGKIADRVIVMAHDYNPRNIDDLNMSLLQGELPLAPIKDVYEAINNAIKEGIPKDKIILQISLNKEIWTLEDKTGIRKWNNNYISYSDIFKLREIGNDIADNYNDRYQSPYIFIYDDDGELEKVVWYEDKRSVRAKIDLAKSFGLSGISIWRIGLIGDEKHDKEDKYYLNVWPEIQKSIH